MTSIIKLAPNVVKTEKSISKNIYINYSLFIIAISFLLRLLCIGSYDLLVEEAYYWNYAQHLDFSYLDHPPMVALLIKISTLIFGTNEFAVRIPSIICWVLAAFFSFRLTELIKRGSGQYAVMLLAILPFFFLQSLVMTPDQPLLVCWSASLYYLYRSLICDESKYWYITGIWLGLGMLSKYTIVLLGPATLLYLIIVPSARHWFSRKEPYVCALIATVLFTPVIYWNATHEWASFVFQSSRRFHSASIFSLHYFIGIMIMFLLPSGIIGLWKLFKRSTLQKTNIDTRNQRFLQVFTLVPLLFFGVISLNHPIKVDWIGPGLLAVLPWLAILINNSLKTRRIWTIAAVALLFIYTSIIGVIVLGIPGVASQNLFQKYISWDNFTEQLNIVAEQIEAKTNTTPIIVPLDVYNISSELSFYQAKRLKQDKTRKIYPVIGRHIFGLNSLMYRYWSNNESLSGKTLILVSTGLSVFDSININNKVIITSPPRELWSHNQGNGLLIEPFYYEIVRMK